MWVIAEYILHSTLSIDPHPHHCSFFIPIINVITALLVPPSFFTLFHGIVPWVTALCPSTCHHFPHVRIGLEKHTRYQYNFQVQHFQRWSLKSQSAIAFLLAVACRIATFLPHHSGGHLPFIPFRFYCDLLYPALRLSEKDGMVASTTEHLQYVVAQWTPQ